MIIQNETVYTVEKANKTINVVREFDAPVEKLWKAWTDRKILDQWWAPQPWKAVTKSMDFRQGGMWLYYMEGPDGTRHYSRADYAIVVPNKFFVSKNGFCDENGNFNPEFSGSQWKVEFYSNGNNTKVEVEIILPSIEHLNKFIEMGFKEGFAAAHNNLDELLAN